MKNLLSILALATVLMVQSCTDRGTTTVYDYRLVNETQHNVAIELEDYYRVFPGYLILKPGESYDWRSGAGE